MVRQQFDVERYWRVTVWYNLDCGLFHVIAKGLRRVGFSWRDIAGVYWGLRLRKAKAVTCSSIESHESIVIFNTHGSKADYINSIVHEAEHVKQAMLFAYMVDDEGEPPAYTIGYLVMRMWEVFRKII